MGLLRQLFELCFLRIGPEDLPGDARLPWVLAAGYVLSGGLVLMADEGFAVGMAQAAVDAALLVFSYLIVSSLLIAALFSGSAPA